MHLLMHRRNRHIQALFLKRMKMFPVVGLVGPRQVGKSTFLREQWVDSARGRSATYVTLDEHNVLQRAKSSPDQFVRASREADHATLIIDEIQKVPPLFDAIKAVVDTDRTPGRFAVTGSVEFSDASGIRESLAGRMGLTRLYPFTLAELDKKSAKARTPWLTGFSRQAAHATPQQIETWMMRGGMPIFCALHDVHERNALIGEWLTAVCHRDIHQLALGKLDGTVALALLQYIARVERFSLSSAIADLGYSRKALQKHLVALETLFLIYRLPNLMRVRHAQSAPHYAIFDAAVVRYLLGHSDDLSTRRAALRTLVLNEIRAQHEYAGVTPPEIGIFSTRGGAYVDLVLRTATAITAVALFVHDTITPYQLRALRAVRLQHPHATLLALAPISDPYQEREITVLPWHYIG